MKREYLKSVIIIKELLDALDRDESLILTTNQGRTRSILLFKESTSPISVKALKHCLETILEAC